jgi:hypothetical protein
VGATICKAPFRSLNIVPHPSEVIMRERYGRNACLFEEINWSGPGDKDRGGL